MAKSLREIIPLNEVLERTQKNRWDPATHNTKNTTPSWAIPGRPDYGNLPTTNKKRRLVPGEGYASNEYIKPKGLNKSTNNKRGYAPGVGYTSKEYAKDREGNWRLKGNFGISKRGRPKAPINSTVAGQKIIRQKIKRAVNNKKRDLQDILKLRFGK